MQYISQFRDILRRDAQNSLLIFRLYDVQLPARRRIRLEACQILRTHRHAHANSYATKLRRPIGISDRRTRRAPQAPTVAAVKMGSASSRPDQDVWSSRHIPNPAQNLGIAANPVILLPT
jgi:hypothetical protein